MARQPRTGRLRAQSFGAVILILIQSAIGVDVNLFVTIPVRHAGAKPSNYFGGSLKSLGWAISHGTPALVVHTALGLLLAIFVVAIVAGSFSLHHVAIRVSAVLGALFTIGAGFNGASFLDFNKDVSSLVMAILAFAAALCFLCILYLLPRNDFSRERNSSIDSP